MVRKSKSSISANRKIVKVLYLNGKSVKIETEVSSKVFKINEKEINSKVKILEYSKIVGIIIRGSKE